MKEYLAYSPGSISTIFSPYFDKDILKTGSLGLSFTINEGVYCDLEESFDYKVTFNNKPVTIPAVKYVIKKIAFLPMIAHFESTLPIGAGFGVSAACALSTAYALNKLYEIGYKDEDLARIAHEADVISRTGLSDVITQVTGGVILRYKKYNPFTVQQLFGFLNQPLYAHVFESLETKKVLEDASLVLQIQTIGDSIVKEIGTTGIDSIDSFLRYSYTFARQSTLLERAELSKILENLNKEKIEASMIMLGKAFFSTRPIEGFSYIKITITNERTHYL